MVNKIKSTDVSMEIESIIKLFILIIIFVVALAYISYTYLNMFGSTLVNIMLGVSLSIFAAMTGTYTRLQISQLKTDNKIRYIENALQNFYLPLQTMFDHDWDNFTVYDYYIANKEKYENIGNYIYLAEENTRNLFKIHPKDGQELKTLLEKVKSDIIIYQRNLDDLTQYKLI